MAVAKKKAPRSRTPRSAGIARAGALAVVFGDQLDAGAPLLEGLDRKSDVILMAEVRAESTDPPSHRQRTILFLSAMRHFARDLRRRGFEVRYVEIDDPDNTQTLGGEIERALAELRSGRLLCTEPGDWRVRRAFEDAAAGSGVAAELLPDAHFLTSTTEFAGWVEGRRRIRMEDFYRWQRRRLGILVDDDGQPEGGRWNFDADNRRPFGRKGPEVRARSTFAPDALTRKVIETVRRELPDLPGRDGDFAWPVTAAQARAALDEFVEHHLGAFGPYQDAMWIGEPLLNHSLLSAALNLKLLDPRECVEAALAAGREGRAPLQSVEGFVRQIIGWREFVRGIYFAEGPDYRTRNSLGADRPLPAAYWTGETDMKCVSESVGEVLDRGYGHHIQRLMVTGNFALLAGIEPVEVADWFLGMFVDGVDWVTVPNVVGMALHADARPGTSEGVVGSKPYASTGRYIERMSNYCASCRFDPKKRTGEGACPFSVLYWDFLLRHRKRFSANQRMALVMKNLDRLDEAERKAIGRDARRLRDPSGAARG
jgi:deoxyribodipyrimidine photolyase-related protein